MKRISSSLFPDRFRWIVFKWNGATINFNTKTSRFVSASFPVFIKQFVFGYKDQKQKKSSEYMGVCLGEDKKIRSLLKEVIKTLKEIEESKKDYGHSMNIWDAQFKAEKAMNKIRKSNLSFVNLSEIDA